MAKVNPPPALRLPNPPKGIEQFPDLVRYVNEMNGLLKQMNHIEFQLWTRTGGGDDLVSSIDAISSTNFYAGGLIGEDENIGHSFFACSDEEGSGAVSFHTPEEVFTWIEDTKAVNYTISHGEWITFTGPRKVTFPLTATAGDKFRITKLVKAVTFDGNGKNLRYGGELYSSGTLPGGAGSVFEIEYFDKSGEWHIV